MDRQELRGSLKQLVRNLRKGKIAEATEIIPEVTDGIKDILLAQEEEKLKNAAFVMRSIVTSFQKQDYVLMADLIEYEILPLLSANSVDN